MNPIQRLVTVDAVADRQEAWRYTPHIDDFTSLGRDWMRTALVAVQVRSS